MNQQHNKKCETKTKQRVKKEINLQLDQSRTQIPHNNRRPRKHYNEERLCVWCTVTGRRKQNPEKPKPDRRTELLFLLEAESVEKNVEM
jgi:hypothetical protein